MYSEMGYANTSMYMRYSQLMSQVMPYARSNLQINANTTNILWPIIFINNFYVYLNNVLKYHCCVILQFARGSVINTGQIINSYSFEIENIKTHTTVIYRKYSRLSWFLGEGTWSSLKHLEIRTSYFLPAEGKMIWTILDTQHYKIQPNKRESE